MAEFIMTELCLRVAFHVNTACFKDIFTVKISKKVKLKIEI